MNYIDPKELMVGDYVYRDGFGIGKVYDVCTTSISVVLKDGKCVTWSKNIEPIQLTYDMLYKNFSGENEIKELVYEWNDIWSNDEVCYYTISYCGRGTHFELTICHLHELQQVVRRSLKREITL